MKPKQFLLVLHSHIPYVLAYGSWPHGMDWLFEAAAESYLPLLEVFERLQDEGQLEVLTSAANHGYFHLLSEDDSIRWHVRQGRYVYEKYLGRRPTGFWLPECAYRPGYAWKSPLGGGETSERVGVDEILSEEGLGCFFVDTHLLSGGEAKGVYLDRFPALKVLENWEEEDQLFSEVVIPDGRII